MSLPFQHNTRINYWLKVFALYALTEACIQLLFYFILNNFGTRPISNLEFHFVMWLAQCCMIWPIWWVAWSVQRYSISVQIVINMIFYAVYSYAWFGPLQDVIGDMYNSLQQLTVPESKRLNAILDRGNQYSYLNYQLLKHAFRLSWFYLAAYFYNYRLEEKTRQELAVANKELQLKMLKWQLNPSFYFKTINNLLEVADSKPSNAALPILQLAKVMEYVIYEAKEKLIAVNKEIQFIHTYTQLINQQHGKAVFEMTVSGNSDQLSIAPLLLAGFIDKIAAANTGAEKRSYQLNLQFISNQLVLQVNGCRQSGSFMYAAEDEALQERLQKLYPSRFSISASNNSEHFKLSLLLDSEK
jgi:Histidine kinase